jgi:hypothetical protein|tara:strand:+ start:417 stop:539 length:123 start_codon:yes stop_codon:yes gene_type:complete
MDYTQAIDKLREAYNRANYESFKKIFEIKIKELIRKQLRE